MHSHSQEKFRPSIAHFDMIVYNSNRVLNAAKIMEMPVMATEQYPKGLGRTVPEIELAKFGIVPFEKTCFTMAIPEVGRMTAYLKRKHLNDSSFLLNCSLCPSWRRSREGPRNL